MPQSDHDHELETLVAQADKLRSELRERYSPIAADAMALRQSAQQLLARADHDRVAALADRNRAYALVERLLVGWDSQLRRARGVYYTPWPIVQYLIRSVDALLRSHLHVAEGLAALASAAADRPRVVDPACGAGVFLAEIIRHVHNRFDASLSTTQAAQLATSLLGMEIVPAAAAAAQLLLSAELQAASDAMPAGQEAVEPTVVADSALQALSTLHVDRMCERGGPLLVVGNPPYANFGRGNRDGWILQLMQPYCAGLQERKHNLHDDLIKFIRWAQWQIDRAGSGIAALVANHAFVAGLTHRAMRQSLAASFQTIYIFDLQGSALRRNPASGAIQLGGKDENVFGVRPGIALCLLLKHAAPLGQCEVLHASLRGSRDNKLSYIQQRDVTTTSWTRVERVGDDAPFAPRSVAPHVVEQYYHGVPLNELFREFISGVQTKQDALFTDFHRPVLARRMEALLRERASAGQTTPQYSSSKLRPYMVAPFDVRWIYYDPQLLGRARFKVMQHMLHGENVALVFMRQSTNAQPYDHFLATRHLVSDRVLHSGHGAPYLAPLWLYDGLSRRSNFSQQFADSVARAMCAKYVGAAHAAGPVEFNAQQLWHYLYGVVHLPQYREPWAGVLGNDFPRIPLPGSRQRFDECGALGQQLLDIHLQAQPAVEHDPADVNGAVVLNANELAADIRKHQPAAWSMRLGGCQVIQRWLRQRRQHALTQFDRQRLESIASALEETARLCEEARRVKWSD